MRFLTTFLTVGTFLLAGGVQAQSATPVADVQPTLAPGDAVRIQVWREPDLSGDFVVNEQGVITLPLLGRMDVTSVPISQLRDKLISAYAVQLRNPSVTITPLRRVYVLGEVAKPGLYPVDPTISLAGLIALAGGATPIGDVQKVRIVRNGTVVVKQIDASSSVGMSNVRSNDEVFVDRRSWLDRNSGVVASAVISTLGIILSVVLR
ncbi:MAG TPA: polysaccharide biosynthesis/export family protein [Gemmatimonadaceae bacterium]|nr:polysaccharide biosynthesis/export family protein [Gemmatimonadaceae bacterium]